MPTKLLISDANVLIDMEVGELIEQMFGLAEYEFAVPDVLYEIELKDGHPNLLELGLKQIELAPAAIKDTVSLAAKYPRPGRMDLMALALAKQERCALLTGDQKLREAGNAEGIIIVGTIWLVDEMLRANAITKKESRNAYTRMKESGRRLPWDEVENRLRN